MPKNRYKHLNQTEKFYIEKRRQACDNENQIAKDLGSSPSTIKREIERNHDTITGLHSGLVAEEKAKSVAL